jgi:accessory secretory protein Asp2
MQILQIGQTDWSKTYRLSQDLQWHFLDPSAEDTFDASAVHNFDAAIITDHCELDVLDALAPLIFPYSLLIDQSIRGQFDSSYNDFFKKKMVSFEDLTDPQSCIDLLPKKFFSHRYSVGAKLPIRKILTAPAHLHKEKVWFEGSTYISTDIDYADTWTQIFFWKLSIEYDNQYATELWMEYKHDGDVSLELDIQFVKSESPEVVLFQKRYNEEDLKFPIVFSHKENGYLVCSVFVKGKGCVQVGHIHYRRSRLGEGIFLPGGKRVIDKDRQALFYYFNPGNLKPPFNIYFSGYRPAEGFGGYEVMKRFGNPFMLLTDPRQEGGSFYTGSDELEDKLCAVICACQKFLGFEEEDLIFSGVSMGSFPALYYGCKFKAQAIIVGKPMVDIERVAKRVRLERPYQFLTVLDIVRFWNRATSDGRVMPIDDFYTSLLAQWAQGDGFGDTKLLIAHMEEDDFDDHAYYTLLKTQSGKKTKIIAKGFEGRHNDQSAKIDDWFVSQFQRTIREYEEGKNEQSTA